MLDNLRGGVEWVQGLSVVPKGLISLAVVIVCAAIITILWQKPPVKPPEPGSTNLSGNAASTGQIGGITTGIYIQAPPVTDQQKEEALSAIQSEIEELATFPNRPNPSQPRTLMEQFAKSQMPHQLYVILGKYYKETILSVPKVGKRLLEYKIAYYNYEKDENEFENETTTHIGTVVSVRFRQAWLIYFRYFLLRSAGFSRQQIVDGGDFLNYSITWDESETVFDGLRKDASIGPKIAEQFGLQNKMLTESTDILNTYTK